MRAIIAILVFNLVSLCMQTIQANELQTATSLVSITKLATVEISEKQTDFLIVTNLDNSPESIGGHLCLTASIHSPSHRIVLAEPDAVALESTKNDQTIAYSASVVKIRSAKGVSKCSAGETELTIGISASGAKAAQQGFYTDNLMLMIVIE